MTSSKATEIRKRLLEFCGIMAFRYHGMDCDIDPFNPSFFHVACNGTETDVNSIDEVMSGQLFDGACLNDIAEEIDILEW